MHKERALEIIQHLKKIAYLVEIYKDNIICKSDLEPSEISEVLQSLVNELEASED